MNIKEKNHRLPRESYSGNISVAFTLCLTGAAQETISPETARQFTDTLSEVVLKEGCIVPVYCFMPDHQHIILTGTRKGSDLWNAVVSYKQRSGFWMSTYKSGIKWQKDFWDHVIRNNEDIASQVRYILDNPVRRGFVSSWQGYPFKGSVGIKLEDVLWGIL